MNMLGIIDFEIVSLPAFEVVQRNIPLPILPKEVTEGFVDSFDDIDYEVRKKQVEVMEATNAFDGFGKNKTFGGTARSGGFYDRDSFTPLGSSSKLKKSKQQDSTEAKAKLDEIVEKNSLFSSDDGDRPNTPVLPTP